MDEYLKFIIADDPDAMPSNVFEARNKRKIRATSLHTSLVKKARAKSHFDDFVDSIERHMERNLHGMKQEYDDAMQKIEKLHNELAKVRAEMATLKQKDAEEVKTAQTKLANLEKFQRKEKQLLAEQIDKLKAEHFNEKNALEQKIAALERNKTKKTCVHCLADVNTLVFCSDQCMR